MKIKIDRNIIKKEFAAKLGRAEQSRKAGLEKLACPPYPTIKTLQKLQKR
ncbi:hypothetical protein KKE19_03110 [Patescibacteria group bacterium]|nr:hypothetical protein [Patescibacteria group bacterium]MBU4274781.1 hypothetical protein [Patescibacteria group bacterium]MBU4367501.1 hypothetical protein [Patescibacteria group bacterium]MBU4462197.1 hypothetical protein [Patescibacteria group bacterium]MCG2699644.1 hypothetical protein [Candidatus Parcubacteria bacterium]